MLSIEVYSPMDTIEGLAECGKLIDKLIRKLKTPALWNWNFVSDAADRGAARSRANRRSCSAT